MARDVPPECSADGCHRLPVAINRDGSVSCYVHAHRPGGVPDPGDQPNPPRAPANIGEALAWWDAWRYPVHPKGT